MNNNQNGKKDFVFIVGCPRSGTYLLSVLLNHNFSIALPIETHFIDLFKNVLPLWGNIEKFENRKKLLRDIYYFIEIWIKTGYSEADLDQLLPYSLLVTKDRSFDIVNSSKNYSDLVSNLFAEYAKIYGADRWGDKTIRFHHVPLEILEKSIPCSKIVHIVRDGRDVCLSWLKAWFGPKSTTEAILEWSKFVSRNRQWGQKHPQKYMEIKYEDLLKNPTAVTENVAAFLNLTKQKKSNHSHTVRMAAALNGGTGAHNLLTKPIKKDNRDKWKSEMPDRDRLFIEYLAGNILKDFGYQTDSIKPSLLSMPDILLRIFCGYLASLMSVNNFKRKLRAALPLALFVSGRLGISLPKILFRN